MTEIKINKWECIVIPDTFPLVKRINYKLEFIRRASTDVNYLNISVTFSGEKIDDLNRLRGFTPLLTDIDLAKLGILCFDDDLCKHIEYRDYDFHKLKTFNYSISIDTLLQNLNQNKLDKLICSY